MANVSKEEIDKLRRDADRHAEEYQQKRKEIEGRIEADGAVYRSDKMFRDNLDKLSENDRVQIEEAVQRVKDALNGDNLDLIKSTSERLSQVWQAASAALYRASSQKSQSGSAGAGNVNGSGSAAQK